MADNPYVNKVVYDGDTLIDLTEDTVAADKLLAGYTAHDASGAAVTGTIADGDNLGYGSSSYLVGTARAGTAYAWTTTQGEIMELGRGTIGTAVVA